MTNRYRLATISLLLGVLFGCSSGPDVIPKPLESQIDRSVTFDQIAQTPDSYVGRTVVVGGEVLKATRRSEGTELEVLELPLDKHHRPAGQRMASRGRFLALDRQGMDPAAFPPGMPVTVVGEVRGATTQRLDESQQRYAMLDIKHVHAWTEDPYERRGWGPSVGVGVGV
ncbi:MAG TPA: Slp family lipoprotein, partial [Gemmatimonadales bacterium]|nr:Slp family lipoprotein [Gemmatimonadales bacterium]